MGEQTILVVLQKEIKPHLRDLISTWQRHNYHPLYLFYDTEDGFPSAKKIAHAAESAIAVLAFTPANRAPHTLLDGPYIELKNNRIIPIGMVPYAGAESIALFIQTTCAVHDRKKSKPNVCMLSQRLPRYITVVNKIHTQLEQKKHLRSLNWTGDVMYKEDVLYGLNRGSALTLYVGHGRASGWVGFRGVKVQEMKLFAHKPTAVIFSLCCETASRRKVAYSFSEQLILEGISAVSIGATRKTLFTNNTRWAVSLGNELLEQVGTIGELIVNAKPSNPAAYKDYRLFGDPTIPIIPDKNFFTDIKHIESYA